MFNSSLAKLSAAVAVVFTVTAFAIPAAQAAPAAEVDTWTALPASVTSVQQVWVLSRTLGMRLHSTTRIVAEPCGSTFTITALYGNGTAAKPAPSLNISQTAGDCDLEPRSFYGTVKTIKTKHGRFIISAGCGWDAKANKPVAGYQGGPCTKKDVKAKGGLITMEPTNAGGTTLQVESDGLTYGQLVVVAKGLKPLS